MAVVAYRIYLDSVLAAEVPAPLTAVSFDDLNLGSTHQITVSAVDDAGNESELSDAQAFTVLGLIEGSGVSDAFGSIITRTHVEQAVLATLIKWIPAYLDETQRQALKVMPLGYPQMLRALEDPDHAAHLQTPSLEVAAELDEIEPHAESFTHIYRVGVYATIDAGSVESSRAVIDAYTAAIGVCLPQHGSLGGLSSSTRLVDAAPEPMTEGSMTGSLVSFRVVVEDAARRYSHATEPPGPGLPPPADLPVHIIEIDEQLVQ
jgi:hypothetical protein